MTQINLKETPDKIDLTPISPEPARDENQEPLPFTKEGMKSVITMYARHLGWDDDATNQALATFERDFNTHGLGARWLAGDNEAKPPYTHARYRTDGQTPDYWSLVGNQEGGIVVERYFHPRRKQPEFVYRVIGRKMPPGMKADGLLHQDALFYYKLQQRFILNVYPDRTLDEFIQRSSDRTIRIAKITLGVASAIVYGLVATGYCAVMGKGTPALDEVRKTDETGAKTSPEVREETRAMSTKTIEVFGVEIKFPYLELSLEELGLLNVDNPEITVLLIQNGTPIVSLEAVGPNQIINLTRGSDTKDNSVKIVLVDVAHPRLRRNIIEQLQLQGLAVISPSNGIQIDKSAHLVIRAKSAQAEIIRQEGDVLLVRRTGVEESVITVPDAGVVANSLPDPGGRLATPVDLSNPPSPQDRQPNQINPNNYQAK